MEAAGLAVCQTPDSDSGTEHLWWVKNAPRSTLRLR